VMTMCTVHVHRESPVPGSPSVGPVFGSAGVVGLQ
jgi:hypothetical protein